MKLTDGLARTRELPEAAMTDELRHHASRAGNEGFNLKRAIFDTISTLVDTAEGSAPVWMLGEFPHLMRGSTDIVTLIHDALRFAWKRCHNSECSTLHVHAEVRHAMVILEIDECPDQFSVGHCLVSVALGRVFVDAPVPVMK